MPRKDQDENCQKLAICAKTINAPFCGLNAEEFNRISKCSSAKKFWDILEVTHEGTNQVKEPKINILVHKYELCKMNGSETIS